MGKKKAVAFNKKKAADKKVKLSNGQVVNVGVWISLIALKLPQSLRYKKGAKKGKLVDHFEELLMIFDKKGKTGGRAGVLKYVEGCYDLLDKAISQALSQIVQA